MKSRCTKVSPREKQKHDLPAILNGTCHTRRTQILFTLLFLPCYPLPFFPYESNTSSQPPMVISTDCLYSPSPCILVTDSHAITTVEVIVRRNRRNGTLLTNIYFFVLSPYFFHSDPPETSLDSRVCSSFGSAWIAGGDYSWGKVGWLA